MEKSTQAKTESVKFSGKIALFYFSGTGNTEKIARLYAKEFQSLGIVCDLYRLPIKQLPDLSAYELVGIGYPVHAFNAPKLVLDFAKSLPKVTSKRAFIFKTSGEPLKINRISSLKLKKILKKQGYCTAEEYHYCMPYNIIFRHSDYAAYKMWTVAKSLVPLDTGEILRGEIRREKGFLFGGFFAFIMRIEHFGAMFNGRFYKVSGNCINCCKCAVNCPMSNIEIKDGKPVFGKNCAMCMRCSFHCPTDSIKIGLFDGWRVNGEYSFEECSEVNNDHENFCRKAYKRYYEQAEERINNCASENI